MGLPTIERRKFERLPLRLPIQFSRALHRNEVIECVTENISGAGVYFVSLRSLVVGERLEIDLHLPPLTSGHNQANVHLRCQAQVVRAQSTRHGLGVGIACRIESYAIRFGDEDLLRDQKARGAKT
jgi:hypothetical protein